VRHYRALFVELLGPGDDGVENIDDVSSRDRDTAPVSDRDQVERLR